MTKSDVRLPAVAGRFYPADPNELRALVRAQLADADGTRGPSLGAVVPHAGLVFSGACAAHVFRRVSIPPTTVLVGPNHRGTLGGRQLAGTWRRGAFATPAGQLAIAEDFVAALLDRCPLIAHDPVAHRDEHCLEVELPFLIESGARTRIVPLVLATDEWGFCECVAAAITETVRSAGHDVLLLASSDMTHYERAESAAAKDRFALDAIVELNGQRMLQECRARRISMCGRAAAAVVVEACRQLGATSAELVDYRHSGWVTGDDASVVAYAGVVIR